MTTLAAYCFRTTNGPGQHEAFGRHLRAVFDKPVGAAATDQKSTNAAFPTLGSPGGDDFCMSDAPPGRQGQWAPARLRPTTPTTIIASESAFSGPSCSPRKR